MLRIADRRLLLFFSFVVSLSQWAVSQNIFHGNAAHTGVYSTPGPTQLARVQWSFHTGGAIVASPTIADSVVYIASMDGYLYAVDQETGKEKWKYKSRTPIASSPAVVDGSVYFVSSMGALGALDAKTGNIKWVLPTEYERKFEARNLHGYPSAAQTMPDAWDLFTSSPTVVNDKVYFGSGDGNVYAADARTGVLQWKFATKDVVHASPAVVGGVVYVGSWDSYFYALDAETGLEKWSLKTGEDPAIHNQVGFQSSPAVLDGVVYVGCRDAHIYAIDAATGRKKWDYPTSKSWVIGTPAVRDGVVFVGTSDSSRFLALDARNGRLKWNFDAKAYVFSSPAIAGDLAYFGSHNGRFYAVNVNTGKLAWEFETDAAKKDPFKVLNADGSLNQKVLYAPVFGDFEDMYLALFKFMSIGGIVSSPALDKGKVYFGSMDGNLYALQ
jgi:outer membrane protein assembly factor BamB